MCVTCGAVVRALWGHVVGGEVVCVVLRVGVKSCIADVRIHLVSLDGRLDEPDDQRESEHACEANRVNKGGHKTHATVSQK